MGYGTSLLKLALKKAKRLGLKSIVLTCDERNVASRKIIERNGGILEKIVRVPGELIKMRKYRIPLWAPAAHG